MAVLSCQQIVLVLDQAKLRNLVNCPSPLTEPIFLLFPQFRSPCTNSRIIALLCDVKWFKRNRSASYNLLTSGYGRWKWNTQLLVLFSITTLVYMCTKGRSTQRFKWRFRMYWGYQIKSKQSNTSWCGHLTNVFESRSWQITVQHFGWFFRCVKFKGNV